MDLRCARSSLSSKYRRLVRCDDRCLKVSNCQPPMERTVRLLLSCHVNTQQTLKTPAQLSPTALGGVRAVALRARTQFGLVRVNPVPEPLHLPLIHLIVLLLRRRHRHRLRPRHHLQRHHRHVRCRPLLQGGRGSWDVTAPVILAQHLGRLLPTVRSPVQHSPLPRRDVRWAEIATS